MRILLCFLLLTFPTLALSDTRFALVIGTSDYDHLADLPNPSDDADAIADLLESLDFDVTEESDRDTARLRAALVDFAKDAKGADVALVYYAGHGTEIAGENRLLPTDADAASLDALAATTVPLTDIATLLADLAPAAILLVDACRNDPFAGTPLATATRGAVPLEADPDRPIAPGFASVRPAEGLVYAFSTAPGKVASDGPADGNSPFAEALLRHLGTPGLELRTVLTLVTQDVYDRTRNTQTPYFESGLPDLIFAAGQPSGLSERDALLLKMADLTPDIRTQVESLAVERSIPLAPLYAAALTLDLATTSREDLTKALTEAADAYIRLQDKLSLLSDADPRVADLRAEAAQALELGERDKAEALFRQAEAIDAAAEDALDVKSMARKTSRAETILLRAEAARAALDYPTAIAALTEAAALYTEAAPLGLPPEAQTKRTTALWDLGNLHSLTGDSTAALAAYADWNTIAQALSDASPDDADLLRNLAFSEEKIASVLIDRGLMDDARSRLHSARKSYEYLATLDPAATAALVDLSRILNSIGKLLLKVEDYREAEKYLIRSLKIQEALYSQGQTDTSSKRSLGISFESMAELYRSLEDYDQAVYWMKRCLTIRLELTSEYPKSFALLDDLAAAAGRMGQINEDMGDLESAIGNYQSSLEIQKMLIEVDPTNVDIQRSLGVAYEALGDIELKTNNFSSARANYSAALEVRLRLHSLDRENVLFGSDVFVIYTKIGYLADLEESYQDAFENFSSAARVAYELIQMQPEKMLWREHLLDMADRSGTALRDLGRNSEALEWFEVSVSMAESLYDLNGGSTESALDYIFTCYQRSTVSPNPRPDLETALAILRKLQSEGRLPPEKLGWISEFEAELAALPPSP